jgi:hypothetical protein
VSVWCVLCADVPQEKRRWQRKRRRQTTTYRIRVVLGSDTLAVEQKSNAGNVLSLAVAKGIHELSEGGGTLNLEKHLVVVVRDLDVQVFALPAVLGLVLHVVGGAVLGHFDGSGCRLCECDAVWGEAWTGTVQVVVSRVRGWLSGAGGEGGHDLPRDEAAFCVVRR